MASASAWRPRRSAGLSQHAQGGDIGRGAAQVVAQQLLGDGQAPVAQGLNRFGQGWFVDGSANLAERRRLRPPLHPQPG